MKDAGIAAPASSGRSPMMWIILTGVTLATIAFGGAYWYFIFRHRDAGGLKATDLFPGLEALNQSREFAVKANQLWAGGRKAEAAAPANKAIAAAQAAVDEPRADTETKLHARIVQAQCRRILGENDAAMSALDAVLKDAVALPNNTVVVNDAKIEWAYAAALAGRNDEALKLLREVERQDEQGSFGHEARLAQARVFEVTGQFGRAVEVYNRIIERYQGPEKQWKHRAEFLLGQLEQRINRSGGSASTPPATPAGTRVREAVKNQVVWTKAGGPYIVEKTVHVPAGATLTIEKGAKVYFAEGAALAVQGTLLARGEPGAAGAVEFVPVGDRLAGYSWLGIEITAEPSQPASVLEHCRIDRAAVGLLCRDSSPRVSRCTITSSGSAGVRIVSTAGAAVKPEIRDTRVEKCAGTSIEIRGKGVDALIAGCTVADGEGPGISSEDSADPRIENTVVRGGAAEGILFLRAGAGRLGAGTEVSENRGHGIRLDYRCTPTIHGVVVGRNLGDGIFVHDSEPKIEKAVIDGNRGSGVTFIFSGAGSLTDCRILNNTRCGVMFENNPGRPTVRGNRIGGNGVGVLVREGADLAFAGNDLSGNRESALHNETGNVVDAGGNFWGPTDEAGIKKLIKGPAKIDGFKTGAM
jgi:parallel beta-helix repeat protein